MKNSPKVLLFGTNCASVLNSLTIGFEKINIPVRAISFDYKRSIYNNYSKIKCICSDNNPNRFKQYLYKIKGFFILMRNLIWCDVVHIYGRNSKPVYWVIARLVKYKFVTFVGSDIRMPEIELSLNPFFEKAFYREDYEYKHESENNAPDLISYLTRLDYGFIVWDTGIFFDRNITKRIGIVPHASINITQNKSVSKKVATDKVLIIHSPTAPVAKGTEFVLKAIDKLKEKNLSFEFKVLTNLPNEEYQKLIMEADIYLDQFIWGAYGVAAQQALQMGKVVVAYMTPERLELYGNDLPIQNADINNLAEVLERLILDKGLRQQISDDSLLYYEKMHLPENVARRMIATYKLLVAEQDTGDQELNKQHLHKATFADQ